MGDIERFSNLNLIKSRFLVFLIFLLATAYFFSVIFFGLDFTDGFYHLNQAILNSNDWSQHKFFLSSVLIKQWIEFFGKNLLVIRFFNALLIYLSALIPVISLKHRASWRELLFVLSIVLVIITPLNANVLGFDTFTLFITSIIFTSFITFMREMTPVKLGLLALLCAIAVFIRLPNIILVILIPIILLIDKLLTGRGFKIYVKRSLIFFILSLGFIAGGYLLMFSSEPNFGESFITNGKYHNIRLLILNYFMDGLTLLFYSTVIFLCYLLIKRKGKNKYVPMLVIIFLILFLSAFIIHTKYSRSYSLFLTSLGLVYSVFQFFDLKAGNRYRIMLVTFMLFLFVNPFGSNTGLLKSSFLFVLFPVILVNGGVNSRKIIITLLLIIVPFSFIEKINAVYEDGRLYQLGKTPDHELLHPIRTTQSRKLFLDKVDKEVDHLKNEGIQVYFYGNKSQILSYLYPGSALDSTSFFQTSDSLLNSDFLQQKIEGFDKAAIFFIDNYPDRIQNSTLQIDQFFKESGYAKIKKKGVIYFSK